jgi:hypothetical protein
LNTLSVALVLTLQMLAQSSTQAFSSDSAIATIKQDGVIRIGRLV